MHREHILGFISTEVYFCTCPTKNLLQNPFRTQCCYQCRAWGGRETLTSPHDSHKICITFYPPKCINRHPHRDWMLLALSLHALMHQSCKNKHHQPMLCSTSSRELCFHSAVPAHYPSPSSNVLLPAQNRVGGLCGKVLHIMIASNIWHHHDLFPNMEKCGVQSNVVVGETYFSGRHHADVLGSKRILIMGEQTQ